MRLRSPDRMRPSTARKSSASRRPLTLAGLYPATDERQDDRTGTSQAGRTDQGGAGWCWGGPAGESPQMRWLLTLLALIAAPAAPRSWRGRLTRATLGLTLAAGPVAMADPAAVPAGRYGQAALERMGAWDAVAPHVVRAENVRAALALVERGAAAFGIVYATDAR